MTVKIIKGHQSKFVTQDGMCCPHCGSQEVHSFDGFPENSATAQNVECLECESTWVEQYQLVGYKDLIIKGDDAVLEQDHGSAKPTEADTNVRPTGSPE